MTVRSKIYRLPAPELPDPANGPTGFENLAKAVENQAFPSLQNWSSAAGDLTRWAEPSKASRTQTIYSVNIPTSGIVGWVDIDANIWGGLTNQQDGCAGFWTIKVNGVVIRQIRWHNWWRIQMNCLYNSVRWPNLSGLPAKIDLVWDQDYAYPSTANVFLISWEMSYQIYGKKVT